MRLVALQDVPDYVGTIRKGQTFICLDSERCDSLIAANMAMPENVTQARPWNGLDWQGATVVILASGSSLTIGQCAAVEQWRRNLQPLVIGENVAPEMPERRYVIAVNTTGLAPTVEMPAGAPWADVLYACDGPWWDEYYARVVVECSGELWTQDPPTATKYGLKLIPSQVGPGLCKTPGRIFQGGNGGYQAIGLAYQAGAKRMILLGFDMHGGHHHANHPRGLNKRLPFKTWLPQFDQLAVDLKESGVEVVNCSPRSALQSFPMMALDEALHAD